MLHKTTSSAREYFKLIPLGVLLLLGGIYLSMIPQKLTWSNQGVDGGDFLAAILTRGIPHPTGYPTYTLLGILAQFIPFGSPYTKTTLVSAIPSALTCGIVSIITLAHADKSSRRLLIPGVYGGLTLGFSPFFWSQAVIVEVLGLHTLFLACSILWVISLQSIHSNGFHKRRLANIILCFLFGLGLGNHVTLILALPYLMLVIIRTYSTCTPRKSILLGVTDQILPVVVGLTVYLYLPIAASFEPPINWGNPQTLAGFLWLISGKSYHNLLFSQPIGEMLGKLSGIFQFIQQQFGLPGIFLAAMGAFDRSFLRPLVRGYLWWLAIVYTIFAVGYNTWDAWGYLLPVLIVISIWIGIAVHKLWKYQPNKIPVGQLVVIILLLAGAWKIPGLYSSIDPRKDLNAYSYAEKYLDYVPANAILITHEDGDTVPLWYYHFGLGWREDVGVIVAPLWNFRWYQDSIRSTYPDIHFPLPEEVISISKMMEYNPGRPVCESWPKSESEFGIYYSCGFP